jgi:hypothetical protein
MKMMGKGTSARAFSLNKPTISMKKVTFPLPAARKARSGVALVIVLCFVVLLTGLVLALMSRSMSNGLISQASANVSKTDLYGHGAIDQVIGDLRQEVVDGSPTTKGAGATMIYRSSTPNVASSTASAQSPDISKVVSYATAVPYNSGPTAYTATTWNTTFPNLVKESSHGVAFYSGANYGGTPPNRAAAVNSTQDVSLNGRYVSFARWNKHLLLPKNTTGSLDTTPTGAFQSPDWILSMADADPVAPVPTTYSAAMSNPQSGSYVVGRYAYAIYNEGGLLDANVAGSPGSAGMTAAQQTLLSKKGPEAFADLTQVGLTQAQVDQLVGWRNNATAQLPPASFPSYTFTSTNIDNYFKYLLGISTRFMTASGSATQSDRFFTSRQQMLSFFQDIAQGNTTTQAQLQNAMMYFTHFSRTLNQPSYWPAPNRPVEVGPWSNGSASGATTGYNNVTKQELNYNPPFRSVRVGSNWSGARNDGSSWISGEPLVKKRFALNRVAWLTPYGPVADDSGNLNASASQIITYLESPGIGLSANFLKQGGPGNIQKYFGLKWTSGPGSGGIGGYWTYNHGAPAVSIGLLNLDVVGAKREPDFFELLQVAVKVGSIANTGVYNGNGEQTQGYFPLQDTQVIRQILQMGANIIDCANPTQYPTQIQYLDPSLTTSNKTRYIYGDTDLPYLYAYREIGFVTQAATGTPGGPNSDPMPPANTPTVANGQVAALMVPIIWNPYDINGPVPISAGGGPIAPQKLRIRVFDGSTWQPSSVGWQIYGEEVTQTAHSVAFTCPPWSETSPPPVGSIFASLTFDNASSNFPSLYREPTPLLQPGIPSGSSLVSQTPTYKEQGVTTFIGFPMGTGVQRWSEMVGSPPKATTYTVNHLESPGNNGGFSYEPPLALTIRLEYDATGSGNWVIYQEYRENGDEGNIDIPYAPTTQTMITPSQGGFWDIGGPPVPGGGGFKSGQRALYDPRVDRWGTSQNLSLFYGSDTMFAFLDSTLTTVQTARPTNTRGNSANESQSSGWVVPGQLSVGMAEQNLVNNITYYADPDQVVRRAMGAYATSTTAGNASPLGLPLAIAQKGLTVSKPLSGGNELVASYSTAKNPDQSESRPIILHRPYRSVAELGYVFSGTPWRNIDFFTPESGYSAILDAFCISDDTRSDAVSAGVVDLNTRQAPVLQALLAGAYQDEDTGTSLSSLTTSAQAAQIAQLLVTRTTVGGNPGAVATGPQPLSNIADLVGRWWKQPAGAAPFDGSKAYDGFSADLGATSANALIERFRETTMRALSDAGQAGTWNLMIDLVAQSGRYPTTAKGLPDFLVEGERHYWVHLAIDRQTGQIIDENIEVVNE